jgi:hypothetical protein
MKFTQIKRLVSNAYDCSNIELYGEIEDGETLEQADEKLKLGLSKLVQDENLKMSLCSDVRSLQNQKQELESDIGLIRTWIDKNRDSLKKAGFSSFLSDDIPF